MKAVKLIVWLCFGLLIGKGLNVLISPSELIYSAILYALPILLLGVQREVVSTKKSLSISGSRIQVESVDVKWQTFWGIRLGNGTEVGREVSWFPDTDWTHLRDGATFVLINVVPFFLPGTSNGKLRRLKN
jgi:hypothetical protein